MKNYFITGTDTNVGKTLVSAILTYALQAYYWKPIQSGTDEQLDRDTIQQLTGLSDAHFIPSSYLLRASLSPDQAAQLENRTIDLNNCIMPIRSRTILVEGAGGVFVPLNSDACMLDLMQMLNLPIIIVSRGTLGTINHTLLTIEVLRQRGLSIRGVIFSGELNFENQKAIEKWGKVPTLLHIPFFDTITSSHLKAWVASHAQKIQDIF